jgi:hypothetical protein
MGLPQATGRATVSRTSLLTIAVCFVGLCLAALFAPGPRRGYTDFLSFYAGAKLVGTPNLYSVPHVHEIQRGLGNKSEVRAFIRPPFYAVLLWPLGRLPYDAAHAVWQVLNVLALAGFIWFWSPRAVFVPLCCLYFPIWINFILGQDIPLILFVVALSGFMLRNGRNFTAGLIFSLCAAKAHLFIFLPLFVLAKRRWKFASGFATGLVALAVISFAAAGTDWPASYLEVLKTNERMQASQSHMPNLNGLLHSLPYSTIWLVVSTIGVALGTWYINRRSSEDEALGSTICAGLLVSLHAFMNDCGLLLPLFISLSNFVGIGRTYILTGLVGFSTVTLGLPSTSWIGQVAILLLFSGLVLKASFESRRLGS